MQGPCHKQVHGWCQWAALPHACFRRFLEQDIYILAEEAKVFGIAASRAPTLDEAARLAALRGQPEVYKASLTEAADWVTRYFDPDSDAVNAMTRSLERLQGQSVSRALPSLEEPLRTFRQVRKERGD